MTEFENQKLSDGHQQDQLYPSLQSSVFPDNTVCNCGAAEQLEEVIKVNHYWQKDYTGLKKDLNTFKARLITTEQQKQLLEEENQSLRRRINCLENATNTEQRPVPKPRAVPAYTTDDIEALKQQLIIYKEDFEQEKEDRSKLSNENNQLKLELQKLKSILDKLTRKNDTIKDNYRRVNTEKEHIINELRRLTTTNSAPASPNAGSSHTVRTPYLPLAPEFTITRSNSQETLRSEDVLSHSARGISPFYGGRVERD